jgi:hypothetical protein
MLRRSEVMVDGVRSVVLQGGPASGEEAIGKSYWSGSANFPAVLPRICRASAKPISRTSLTTQWPDTPAILVVC